MDAMYALFKPKEAVKRVWTCTSGFAGATKTGPVLTYSDETFMNMLNSFCNKNKNEAIKTKGSMDIALRVLEVHYHGRQLNYEQMSKRRNEVAESQKNDVVLGVQVGDFIKVIPGTIAGAGFGAAWSIYDKFPFETVLLVTLVCGIIAFIVQFVIALYIRTRIRWNNIIHDFETTLYYQDYLVKCWSVLRSLMEELSDTPSNEEKARALMRSNDEFVIGLVEPMWPRFCPCMTKHIRERKISPEVWVLCETPLTTTPSICPNASKEPSNITKWWYTDRFARFSKIDANESLADRIAAIDQIEKDPCTIDAPK